MPTSCPPQFLLCLTEEVCEEASDPPSPAILPAALRAYLSCSPPKKKTGKGGGLLRGPPSSPPQKKNTKKRKEKGGGDECKHSRGILLTMRRAEVLTSLFVFSILVHLCLGGDAHHLCRSLLDAADDTSMIRILLRDFLAGYQKKRI